MSSRIYSYDQRRAAVDDYNASGDTMTAVARRHGVSRNALTDWVRAEEGVGLTGGRWVNVRGVMRWEAFVAPSVRDLSDRERRIEWEDAMFDEDEARDLHARYANGCREGRTVVGERVYQRRKKRAHYARKRAA